MQSDPPFDPTGITRRELMKLVASAGTAAVLYADRATAAAVSAEEGSVIYDDHVLFDNSPADGGYDASTCSLVAPARSKPSTENFRSIPSAS